MRLYWFGLIMLVKKFILRQNTGRVICDFAQKMGVVYIKLAQILAMQNVGEIFNEQDRQQLAKICDRCDPIPFAKVQKILQSEYGENYMQYFTSVDPIPVGSASISQVHHATLKDGTEVALKIKRQDLTRRIQRDVRQIRRIIRRYGHLACFRNLIGADKGLTYYLDWIYQETDFSNEQQNILRYQDFAKSINGKVKNVTVKIVTPRLFQELCTKNIIAMEFIHETTINRTPLTPQNKAKVIQAIDAYMSLSFYALLHGKTIVFHGDSHGGNIYLDRDGNIGFLDMGLIFELNAAEAELARQLLLDAYTGKTGTLVDLLLEHSSFEQVDRKELAVMMGEINQRMHQISIEQFFVEMMGVFTKHDVAPPEFLFKMTKSFLALFGINTIVGNPMNTQKLLARQVAEFYIDRTIKDTRTIVCSGLNLVPNFINISLHDGLAGGLASQIDSLENICSQCQQAFEHYREVLTLVKNANSKTSFADK